MVGTTISHYKVLEKIGQGGMGEVYRATDTKLNRDVALKILPEQFASDSQRMGRFQREAEVLASLDHPNIGQIYGIEEASQTKALVLQLIEGPTLAEKIAQGPIPVEEALKIALQITEGMEAAHEKGIIHRDLKPANIKITPEGQVKILDFGLAKALEGETPATDLSQSPTLTAAATQAGVILGTAAYMSPEQAKGKPVDKRADIFAFGAVLYELLTGKRAFEGETITETLGAILHKEPDWEALPGAISQRIRDLLQRCFEKDFQDRLPHIAEARFQIKKALTEPTTPLPIGRSRVEQPALRGWVMLVGLAVAGAIISGVAVWSVMRSRTQMQVEQAPARLIIDSGPDYHIPSGGYSGGATGAYAETLAISRDGQYVVYVASDSDETQLYLRSIDEFEPRPLPGTENATDPFFSPDNQWIGFLAGTELKTVSLTGGSPVSLSSLTSWNVVGGLAWGPNDMIVLSSTNSGLWQVPASGGEAQPLTHLDTDKGETRHKDPHFLPSGDGLLFTVISPEGLKIWVLSLESGGRRELLDGLRPRYVSSGHLVFQRGDALYAVPFDVDRLEVTGSASRLPTQVRTQLLRDADFAISLTGTMAYVPAVETSGGTLVWVDRNGTELETLTDATGLYSQPRLSPDGQHLAVSIGEGGNQDIWIYEVDRGTRIRLTTDRQNALPVWTPDGTRITFESQTTNLHWKPADGSGQAEPLLTGASRLASASWSPDGQTLAFVKVSPTTGRDLWVLPREGDPSSFLSTAANEIDPRFSPDGHWLAYVSNESGREEVYVQPFPGPGGKQPISSEGGNDPVWSPAGGELFYRRGRQMMAVPVETEPSFRAATPRVLFEGPYYSVPGSANYDVSPDGQRFVMVRSNETTSTQINVVLNWFEELKRLVPTN